MLTPKERSLIKGAIRRVFARSDLRRQVIAASILPNHVDTTRPRVKTWCVCKLCKKPTPKSYMEVDHVVPLIPLDSSLEEMSWDQVVARLWCPVKNLNAVCETCHKEKTKAEAKKRREYKKYGRSRKKRTLYRRNS